MNIIVDNCKTCHGSTSAGFAGINYIEDIQRNIEEGLIIPGDAENSPLYDSLLTERRITSARMPTTGELPDEEKEIIKAWINSGALEGSSGNIIAFSETLQSNEEVFQTVLNDAQELKAQGTPLQNIRYFSAAHLNNGVTNADILRQYKASLAKIVNSLSWMPELVIPTPLNNSSLLFRIDISQLGWSTEKWNALENDYPFKMLPSEEESPMDPNNREDFKELSLLKNIKEEVGTPIPVMRMDWFIHKVATPETYYAMLDIPEDILALETSLGIDVKENILNGRAARAGFLISGVSTSNRIVERHPTEYGSYWKSYDFQSNEAPANIFQAPLGPQFQGLTDLLSQQDKQFKHDGGEMIFTLPNGLQAYALTGSTDNRIPLGPTAIVQDKGRDDRVINNGISCIACHSRGMNRGVDEIRETLDESLALESQEVRDLAKSLYVERDVLSGLYDIDENNFLAALQQIGIDGKSHEPVGPVFYRYESELDIIQVSSELNTTPEKLREKIESTPQLKSLLYNLTSPLKKIERGHFDKNFSKIYEATKTKRTEEGEEVDSESESETSD